jgi:hypothetical protein
VDVPVPLWRHTASASAATRSRWQWTWVGDDAVFKKYRKKLGLVGTWGSGQEKRVLSGIDGVLLVVFVMEEIIFSLKHYWRVVEYESLESKALPYGAPGKTA